MGDTKLDFYSQRRILSIIPSRILFIIGGIILELIIYFLLPSENIIIRTWLTSLLALVTIWGFICIKYRMKLPLQSDVLIMIGYSIANLLPPLYISIFVNSKPILDGLNISDMYPEVSLITLVGASALLIGYDIVRQKKQKAISVYEHFVFQERDIAKFVIIIGAIVWIARGIALSKGGYYTAYQDPEYLDSRFQSFIAQITTNGIVVPILLWLVASKNKRWRPWALLFTAADLAWYIPSGSSSLIFTVLFSLVLVTWWRTNRLPIIKFTVLLFIGLMAIPIIREYRSTIGLFTEMTQINLSTSFAAAAESKERLADLQEKTEISYIDHFFSRVYDGQYLAYLLKNYKSSHEWEYGETYLSRLPFVFIPYFLYTDRPLLLLAINEWFDLFHGSGPATLLGEAYVNFSYFGIPMVCFMMGVIFAFYDKYTINKDKHGIMVVVVYLFFGSNFMFRVPLNCFADILGNLRNAIVMMIFFQLILKWLHNCNLKHVALHDSHQEI